MKIKTFVGINLTINYLQENVTRKDTGSTSGAYTINGSIEIPDNATGMLEDYAAMDNLAPEMQTPRIYSETNKTSSDLLGYCNATDEDLDNVSYYWKWYVNDVGNISGATSENYTQGKERNIANISSGNLSMGDKWTLSCLANDGTLNSSWLNSSLNIKSPPTIIANATSPAIVYTNTDWMLNLTVSDPDDGDVLTTYTQFYVNGSASGLMHSLNVTNGTNTNVANLSSTSFFKGANLTAEFWAGDETENTTKYNATEVTVSNSLPSQVILSYPENNDSFFTNRTPKYNWATSTDVDNDALTYQILVSLNPDVSSPLTNETGISNTYYIQPSELDFATYYWRVRANDSDNYGTWSDIWNFTLVPSVSIKLTQNSINFGTMAQFEVNDTTNNQPAPFKLENDGNTEANVSVNSSSLWVSASAQLNTSYYQFKADNSEANSFNWLNSQTTWANMSDISKSIINTLNHTDSNDLAEIDIRVEVASDEPPLSKSASLIFEAGES